MAPAMKVQVSVNVKMASKLTADNTCFRMVCKPAETVASFKQRVCDVMSVPFPDQALIHAGKVLGDDTIFADCGIHEEPSLDFVVNATESTLSDQLFELLPERAVSLDELESIYTLKCGASVSQALHMLGCGGTIGDFLRGKERAARFVVNSAGFVQSAEAAQKCPKQVSPRAEPDAAMLQSSGEEEESLSQEEVFFATHKHQRMQKLDALLSCIQDLTVIDAEIENITNRLDIGVQSEKPKRRASKWIKKESSKYPGRFYYVNSETGESSWKVPKDFCPAASTPTFAPPPGLSLQASSTSAKKRATPISVPVPEDSELDCPESKDVPMTVPLPKECLNEVATRGAPGLKLPLRLLSALF
eukprot:TRINITY_DN125303_c0_g1_i1.p1 TRINITY_DN125303_c0_g1~~TRINITY_DN125303_c0_g1_i1.p1  ORF type:complete len:360 (-),score=96.64 TRINITY_DN125303_c0_g1_i1:236-1315(-)